VYGRFGVGCLRVLKKALLLGATYALGYSLSMER
jgi:hypothetical protein